MKTIDYKQGSEEWLNFRKDKVSGTRFSKLLSSKKDTRMGLIYELISAKYSTYVKDSFVSNDMSRGTDEESF